MIIYPPPFKSKTSHCIWTELALWFSLSFLKTSMTIYKTSGFNCFSSNTALMLTDLDPNPNPGRRQEAGAECSLTLKAWLIQTMLELRPKGRQLHQESFVPLLTTVSQQIHTPTCVSLTTDRFLLHPRNLARSFRKLYFCSVPCHFMCFQASLFKAMCFSLPSQLFPAI